MTKEPLMTDAQVSQADRESAADLYEQWRPSEFCTFKAMRAGGLDDLPWIQAFAKHGAQAFEAGQAAGIEAAATWLRQETEAYCHEQARVETAPDRIYRMGQKDALLFAFDGVSTLSPSAIAPAGKEAK